MLAPWGKPAAEGTARRRHRGAAGALARSDRVPALAEARRQFSWPTSSRRRNIVGAPGPERAVSTAMAHSRTTRVVYPDRCWSSRSSPM